MIITVAAVKGGVGKTTLAVVLAETLSRALPEGESALLLDLDPQGSAESYVEDTDDLQTRFEAVKFRTAGQVPRLIRDLAAGEQIVVIDTPPGFLDVADAAIGESDFVLVPSQPEKDPLAQAVETLRMADGVAPAWIVLNMVNSSSNDAPVARRLLQNAEYNLLEVELPRWVSIARINGGRWTSDDRTLELFKSFAESVLEKVAA